jgi:hypothetical protein
MDNLARLFPTHQWQTTDSLRGCFVGEDVWIDGKGRIAELAVSAMGAMHPLSGDFRAGFSFV